MYCTYEQYQVYGGSLPESQFNLFCPRASREIDRLTLGRAAKYQDKLPDELAGACAQIIDLLYTDKELGRKVDLLKRYAR